MRLDNKVCVVTGAGQGMGRAIARRLAAEGAHVAAIDVNLEAAQATLEGSAGLALRIDIGDSAAVGKAQECARMKKRIADYEAATAKGGKGSNAETIKKAYRALAQVKARLDLE